MLNNLWKNLWTRHNRSKKLLTLISPQAIYAEQLNQSSHNAQQRDQSIQNNFNRSYNRTQWFGLLLGPLVFCLLYGALN